MSRKSNFLLALVCALALTEATAQGSSTANNGIKGSPYLDEAYVEGVIYFGTSSRNAPVRYNAFQDLIEYKQNGQAMLLDPTPTIKKVHFGNATFVVQQHEFNGNKKLGYLALLDSGKVMLFSKKVITFAKKSRALDGSEQPAAYNRSPDVYYFKIGDGALQEIESVKSMIATFPDKQEELTQFAKKEKVSTRKEESLVQLVQFYNSL